MLDNPGRGQQPIVSKEGKEEMLENCNLLIIQEELELELQDCASKIHSCLWKMLAIIL